MGKHWIVTGVIAISFVAFTIGVFSPAVIVWNGSTLLTGGKDFSAGYFSTCSDSSDSSTCTDYTKAIYHCSNDDNNYNYPSGFPYYGYTGSSQTKFVDQSTCQRTVAAEAFGILAVVFSLVATLSAFCSNRTHKHAGSSTAFLAFIFGIIAFSVYLSASWQYLRALTLNQSTTISDAVNNNYVKLGYSAGFQIVGIVFAFFGSLLACVYTRKPRGIPLLG